MISRLRQMVDEARFVAPLDVFILAVAAKCNPRELMASRSQLAHQVVSAAIRQSHVANEQVERVFIGQSQRRRRVAGRFNLVAFGRQDRLQYSTNALGGDLQAFGEPCSLKWDN